jgi:FtsZ-interacting cell division protein ZipA
MPRGLQLTFIIIGLLVIGALLFYIWRQSRRLAEERLRQKKTEEFQARRRDEMVESIRIIAQAVVEEQVEHSEACLRLKGLLDYVAPELLEQAPYRVLLEVHNKIQHMPTHRARKATDAKLVQKMDKERFAVEKEHAAEVREAAMALRHYRFD